MIVARPARMVDVEHSFAPQALLCTDPAEDPTRILQWFVLRWQLEVTPYRVRGRLFQEVRTHLGVETQCQWSDLAIARTTPVLLGLFSWTTLAAHALQNRRPMTQRTAAWYDKPSPTFVDAIALVRRRLRLASEGFSLSGADPDMQELPDRSVPPTCGLPRLRRLKCVKSSLKDFENVIVSHPYHLASDTFQRLVFYMAALRTNSDSVLVFEEPEAHAFPYYTKYLAERIVLDDRGNQYFVSTHNPYFLLPILETTLSDDVAVFITYYDAYRTQIRQLSLDDLARISDEIDVFANIEMFLRINDLRRVQS